jgi:hypothetical protein
MLETKKTAIAFDEHELLKLGEIINDSAKTEAFTNLLLKDAG